MSTAAIPAGTDPDQDLDTLAAEELRAEIRRLRAAIRTHRDSSGHALCWFQPQLWSLLPEGGGPLAPLVVPDWPQFMAGCVRYRRSLDTQLPEASRAPLEPPASFD